jgi:hypothetical protein
LTALIIGVVLLAAFGPILWMLPSRSDRRLSAMRTRARNLGIAVEITQLDALDADAASRVSAGGVRRDPKVVCAAYRLGLRRMAHAAPQWKLLYKADTDEGPIPGWLLDAAAGGDHNRARNPAVDVRYWTQVAQVIAQLPADALALAADATEVTCWWRERTSAEDAVASVDRLHDLLQKLVEIQLLEDQKAHPDETAEGVANDPTERR